MCARRTTDALPWHPANTLMSNTFVYRHGVCKDASMHPSTQQTAEFAKQHWEINVKLLSIHAAENQPQAVLWIISWRIRCSQYSDLFPSKVTLRDMLVGAEFGKFWNNTIFLRKIGNRAHRKVDCANTFIFPYSPTHIIVSSTLIFFSFSSLFSTKMAGNPSTKQKQKQHSHNPQASRSKDARKQKRLLDEQEIQSLEQDSRNFVSNLDLQCQSSRKGGWVK